jgi:6-phosphogluconolactonase
VRISLTRRAIQQAQEVWLLAAGAGKAAAVSLALGRAADVAVPAATARGRHRTLLLLDRLAAAEVPRRRGATARARAVSPPSSAPATAQPATPQMP